MNAKLREVVIVVAILNLACKLKFSMHSIARAVLSITITRLAYLSRDLALLESRQPE